MTQQNDEDFVTSAFSELPPVEASARLRRMVFAIPLEHTREASFVWPWPKLWQPVLAWGALAAAGYFAGFLPFVTPENASTGATAELGTQSAPATTVAEANDTDAGDAGTNDTLTSDSLASDQETELLETLDGLFAMASQEQWEDWDSDWTEPAPSPQEIAQ